MDVLLDLPLLITMKQNPNEAEKNAVSRVQQKQTDDAPPYY
jgi:hypothetical protein